MDDIELICIKEDEYDFPKKRLTLEKSYTGYITGRIWEQRYRIKCDDGIYREYDKSFFVERSERIRNQRNHKLSKLLKNEIRTR